MKTVYFVRHGESEANVGASVFQGEESQLTDKGRQQAKFIGQRCATLAFETMLCSPAVRTRQTAEEITDVTGKEPEIQEIFVERKLPTELLAKPRQRTDPDSITEKMYRDWFKTFYTTGIRIGDGENFEILRERVAGALHYLRERPESKIIVVTHGFFLHMLVGLVLLKDRFDVELFSRMGRAIWMDNTGLTRLDFMTPEDNKMHDGQPYEGWVLRVWNDHAHLG